MQVILLQNVENLGRRGDVVNVEPDYARSSLLPQGIALEGTRYIVVSAEFSRRSGTKSGSQNGPETTDRPGSPSTSASLHSVLGQLSSAANEIRDGYSDPTHRGLAWRSFQRLAVVSLWEAIEGQEDDPYRLQLADVLDAAVSRLEAFQLNEAHLSAIQATLARLSAENVTEQDVDDCENIWRGAEVETIPCLREAFEEWLTASESVHG